MKPESSLPCSKQPAIGLYPRPKEFNQNPATLPKIHSNIIVPSTQKVSDSLA
jgi:hypothetical protein